MRRLLPCAVVVGALFSNRNAAAAPSGRLVYSRAPAAESCPDEATLRRAVAARVGYDPFFPWAARTVVANIEKRNGEFVATVSLVDEHGIAHGARQLRTRGNCAELLDAVALTIAIAVDPEILTHPPASPAPASPPPADADAAVAPPLTPAPPPARAPVSPPPLLPTTPAAFEATLGIVASSGNAPNIAAGLSAGAQIRWPDLSVALEGRLDAPASRSAEGGGDVSSWLALGAIVPCGYFGPVIVCAVGQGGAMRVSSDGVPDRRTKWTGSWEVGGRMGVLVPVSESASLRVRWDLLANLDRASLELRGAPVWTAAPLTSSLGVDLVLRFR